MQVDRVRHDGRAEHADRKDCAFGATECRHQPGYSLLGVRRRGDQSRQETDGDDRQHSGDDTLERLLAPGVLQEQQAGRHRGGDECTSHQRQAEEQVERDRAAHDLRQIGRHGDQLSLDPVTDPRHGGVAARHQRRQRLPGQPAHFRR